MTKRTMKMPVIVDAVVVNVMIVAATIAGTLVRNVED